MDALKKTLLEVEEAVPADHNTHRDDGDTATNHDSFTNFIYHLMFPAILLWQFHTVLSSEDVPGPGVTAAVVNNVIFLFASMGVLYRFTYFMNDFDPERMLFHVPEVITNVVLSLMLFHRADLAFRALSFGSVSLSVMASVMTIRLLFQEDDDGAQRQENPVENASAPVVLTACRVV